MNAKEFTFQGKKLKLVFLTVVGSTLHRLDLDKSDVDYKGVFVWDKKVVSGLEETMDVLDRKKTKKEDWVELLEQFNKEFNLNLKPEDDLDLFEARKFFLTSLKNDFNMFDMLFSDKVLFNTSFFQKVLDNNTKFLDLNAAKSRFFGMSSQSLKNFKKNGSFKDGAKSLQFLFSLKHLVLEHKYFVKLPDNERNEVLEVKKGNVDFPTLEKRWKKLDSELNQLCDSLDLNEVKPDKELLNKLLVDLTLNNN